MTTAPCLYPAGAPDVVELTLPYPPSINHYWKHVYVEKFKSVRVFTTAEGKDYRTNVQAIILSEGKNASLKGFLKLEATFFPPDNLRRDLDNGLKALLDALKNNDEGPGYGIRMGVYGDDSQIKEMTLRFGPTVKDGKVQVRISTIGI